MYLVGQLLVDSVRHLLFTSANMFLPWQDTNYLHELVRKAIHISLGLLICLGISNHWITPFHLFILLVAVILLSFISRKVKLPFINVLLKNFDRPNHFPARGLITYLVGSILSLELFPLPFALASIMILALGDGTAALARPWSKRKSSISTKHLLEESIVGVILGALGAMLFVSPIQAIIASGCAMVLEAIEVKFNNDILDDNILTPLAAGTSLLLLVKFGLFI